MQDRMQTPVAVVVMGVTGAGKTTVGQLLAERMGWPFFDADDFHPEANVVKMRRGVALVDEDRLPWLEALGTLIRASLERGSSLVLACSALRESYRRILSGGGDQRVCFVHLSAPEAVIRERLQARVGHFMNPALLESQIQTLETPAGAITIDARPGPEQIVADIRERLAL